MADTASEYMNPAADVRSALRYLVTHFSDAPLRSGKAIRELFQDDYQEFRAAAIELLGEGEEIRGCRYLVTVLWVNGLLISILGDTSLPKEISLKVAATAALVDPQLHIRIIRYLVDEMLEGKEMEELTANRLLEVLGSITHGIGTQRFIRQMLMHPSARIRSKITLLLDHSGAGARALRSILNDPEEDQRVRANALEALWFTNCPDFIAIFRDCVTDGENRVAGNAVFGLFAAGDLAAIPALMRMAGSESRASQTTAVWVMGKTRDPRFLRRVASFLGEAQGPARRTIFKAMESIKTAALLRSQSKPLSLRVLVAQNTEWGHARLVLSVTCSATGAPLSIHPTGFIPMVAGEPVADYFCAERRSDRICVGFVLPRRPRSTDPLRVAMDRALLACLSLKPKPEQWALSRYHPGSDASPAFAALNVSETAGFYLSDPRTRESASGSRPMHSRSFTSNSEALRDILDAPGLRYETCSSALEAAYALAAGVLPSRGARHLVIVTENGEPSDEPIAEQLIEAARITGCCISAICLGPNPRIADICSQTSGIYREIDSPNLLVSELLLVYSSLKGHYHLEFDCPEAVLLKLPVSIQVNSDDATGTTDVTFDDIIASDMIDTRTGAAIEPHAGSH